MQHVRELQLERMTPEQRTQLQEKVERQRQTERMRRTSLSMSSHSMRSRTLLHEGLTQMSHSATARECADAQRRWCSAQTASRSRTMRSLSTMESDRLETTDVWRDEHEEEEGFAEIAAMMGTPSVTMRRSSGIGEQGAERRQNRATDESARRLEELLKQLREEPTEDDEIVAKFAMYETYGQEVERMRTELFKFYEEQDLPQAVARDMQQQLKAIDSHEAMGIPDEAREWFVYHMMKRAERNSWAMDNALAALKSKLELIAKSTQTDCPICLEAFNEDRPAEMLACCHSVCAECWSHWTAVKQGRPFCPLCRHSEFIHTLAAHAAPGSGLASIVSVDELSSASSRGDLLGDLTPNPNGGSIWRRLGSWLRCWRRARPVRRRRRFPFNWLPCC